MIEWNEKKRLENIKKHNIDFIDCAPVLHDPESHITEDPDHDEQRYVALGMDGYGRILVVVYCWNEDNCRIISARKASKTERKVYEKGI